MQKHMKEGFDAILKECINTLKGASWDPVHTRDIDKVSSCPSGLARQQSVFEREK